MRPLFRVAAIWLLWLVTAAANSQTQPQSTQTGTASTHSHSEYLKPGSQIRLTSPAHFSMRVGQNLAAELQFDTSEASGDISISFHGEKGIQLTGQQTEWSLASPESGQLILPLTLQTESAGRHYVHIFIEELRGDRKLNRSTAIVIDVEGTPRTKASAAGKPVNLPATIQVH